MEYLNGLGFTRETTLRWNDLENETVLLRNDSENVEFEIPYYQYKEDFGLNW